MPENPISPDASPDDASTVSIAKTELVALLDKCERLEADATRYRDDLQRVLGCLSQVAPALAGGGPASLVKTLTNAKKMAAVKAALARDLFPVLERYQLKPEQTDG